MPTPHNVLNYEVGGSVVILGGVDLGNIVSLQIDPTQIEVLQHFTSRSGTRKIDRQVITQKRLTFRIGLDEHAAAIWRLYFMGGGTGLTVTPLTNPLPERNIYLRWLNEDADIVSYSHTRMSVRPAEAMDFGEFTDWIKLTLELEALEDEAQVGSEQGTFTFVA